MQDFFVVRLCFIGNFMLGTMATVVPDCTTRFWYSNLQENSQKMSSHLE
jgi:hypothetical protein